MFSLPNIREMNDTAARSKKKLERAARTGRLDGKQIPCEHAGDECRGEMHYTLWYDIFSDDPKGVLGLCEHHEGYYGSPDEGFFYCDECQRTMVENYTGELYYVHTDDGEQLCLPCAAQRYIEDEDNWLELSPEVIATVDFARMRKAKHVIGVRMPVPKEIEEFGEGVTFDSSTGKQVAGFSSTFENLDHGPSELRQTLTEAMQAGHKRALLILDGGFQFAVSIGVYVDAAKPQAQVKRKSA